VVDALTGAGCAVYACDHLGHGRSDGDRSLIRSFDHLADDFDRVAGVAHHQHPDVPIATIGHSMGGLVAVRHAERYPDRIDALVLSGPVLGDWVAAKAMLDAPEIPDAPLDPSTLSRDEDVGIAYAADPLVYRGPFRRETLESFVAALEAASADRDRITMPVLYLHGEEDALVPMGPSRAEIELFPSDDVTIRVYPGARHEVFNETNRDEVLADVIAFLRRVAST
jgi:alpha-beta hydrolase superfamily lysophospholipase